MIKRESFCLGGLVIQISMTVACVFWTVPAAGEVKSITVTGEYRMGDNDTRTDAKRLALLDAKRLALEQAGTYLESVTEVKSLQVSHDELRAYTAGIIEVTEQVAHDVMEGATHVVRVEVTAKIDTEMVARQIDALRKNETAKVELLRFRAEGDRLRHELEMKSRELAAQKSKSEVERATRERQQLLRGQDILSIVRSGLAALGEALSLQFGYEAALSSVPTMKALKKWAEVQGAPESFISDLRLKLEGAEQALAGLNEKFLKAMGKARGLAEQAIALGPSEYDAAAHSLMGAVLLEEGDAISAVKEFRTALRLQESDTRDMVQEFGTHPRLQELVAMDQKLLAQHHFDLAKALKTSGDLSAAVEGFRKAAALAPEQKLYHFYLGEALRESGDLAGAVLAYRKAAQLEPNSSQTHLKLGEALEQLGNLADAVDEYRIAIRLEPNILAADWSVPRTLAMMGKWDEAFREIRGYCRTAVPVLCVLGEDDASLATSLSTRFMNAGNRAGAIAAAHYAVRIGPKTFANHVVLAGIFVWAGDLPGANREYRAAIQLEPDRGHTHGQFAAVLAEMGDIDGAIREAHRALQLEPANEEAHFALGKARLAKGEKAAAAQELREFLKRTTSKLDTDALLKDPKISMETKLKVLEALKPEMGGLSRDARQKIAREIQKMTEEAVRQNAVPVRLVGDDKELARISDAVTTLRDLSR